MPDTLLARRSCIADLVRPGRYGGPGEAGANLAELTPGVLLGVSVHRAAQGAVHGAADLSLPEPGFLTRTGSHIVAWTGPDQYLAIGFGSDAVAPALLARDGRGLSLTDLTGSRLMLRVSGRRAREGLSKLAPFDLHPDSFGPGRVASTVMAHMPVLVLQTEANPTYLLLCYRSFGRTLWNALTAALTEHGYVVGSEVK